MPTIRGENGKQVRVTMGDILRGTRKIKVEKAEVAARKVVRRLIFPLTITMLLRSLFFPSLSYQVDKARIRGTDNTYTARQVS